jgi:DNA-binding NarL/FixJ family response regulator
MDLQMPGMSSIECIIAIRRAFPNARIIILTTYPGDVQVVLAEGRRARLLVNKVR